MKTHALERITGAVKNSYGFIYGRNKAIGHTKYPSADSFARMLIDLNRYVKPRLYIMDGIVAMEGNGPGSGDPVNMNVLLISEDPVALDSVFCSLIHLKPQMVPTNFHGEKMGLGSWKSECIELLTPEGEISIEEAVRRYGNPDFRVDRRAVRNGTWERLAKALNIFQKKPYIDEKKCARCGICVESCPVQGKAVNFKNGKAKPPVYDYKKCIRCFCCQEMCPKKAIRVK
jgi:Pyruvate/2-oxoacid:ferredoxin oxidoreductase delta subunit